MGMGRRGCVSEGRMSSCDSAMSVLSHPTWDPPRRCEDLQQSGRLTFTFAFFLEKNEACDAQSSLGLWVNIWGQGTPTLRWLCVQVTVIMETQQDLGTSRRYLEKLPNMVVSPCLSQLFISSHHVYKRPQSILIDFSAYEERVLVFIENLEV